MRGWRRRLGALATVTSLAGSPAMLTRVCEEEPLPSIIGSGPPIVGPVTELTLSSAKVSDHPIISAGNPPGPPVAIPPQEISEQRLHSAANNTPI